MFTCDDEQDASGEAHLSLGGILHPVHRQALQGEKGNHRAEHTQHHTHYHQGSHSLEGAWWTKATNTQ